MIFPRKMNARHSDPWHIEVRSAARMPLAVCVTQHSSSSNLFGYPSGNGTALWWRLLRGLRAMISKLP
jgi:hypothetical protein